jgi:hypothetical protein
MSATEKRIAFHEAAHAVVARLRGVEITLTIARGD